MAQLLREHISIMVKEFIFRLLVHVIILVAPCRLAARLAFPFFSNLMPFIECFVVGLSVARVILAQRLQQ